MEYVNGIKISVRNEGRPSSILLQGIFVDSFIIMTPTKTRTGAVAVSGTEPNSGDFSGKLGELEFKEWLCQKVQYRDNGNSETDD